MLGLRPARVRLPQIASEARSGGEASSPRVRADVQLVVHTIAELLRFDPRGAGLARRSDRRAGARERRASRPRPQAAKDHRSAGATGSRAGSAACPVLRQLVPTTVDRPSRRSAPEAAEAHRAKARWATRAQEAYSDAGSARTGHEHAGSEAGHVSAMRELPRRPPTVIR